MAGPTGDQAQGATDAIADAVTRRSILVSRYDADLSRRVLSMLTDLERDLRAQILEIDPTGVTQTSARLTRLRNLLDETRAAIRDTYRRIRLLSERELTELLELEASATRSVIVDSFAGASYRLAVALPTETYLANLAADHVIVGEPLRNWWGRQEVALQNAIEREMRIGLSAGETVDQLARRLVGGTRSGVAIRGVMATSRANAVTIARTAAAAVGNTARDAVYQANLDVIQAKQHLSRLDSRTSPVCIARAGRKWDAKTLRPIGHDFPYQIPPLHPRCRSVIVPIVVGAEAAEDLSADTWINRLSAAQQDDIFGPGRARMFRAGSITSADLVDQTGRPLTLAQLRSAA